MYSYIWLMKKHLHGYVIVLDLWRANSEHVRICVCVCVSVFWNHHFCLTFEIITFVWHLSSGIWHQVDTWCRHAWLVFCISFCWHASLSILVFDFFFVRFFVVFDWWMFMSLEYKTPTWRLPNLQAHKLAIIS